MPFDDCDRFECKNVEFLHKKNKGRLLDRQKEIINAR